MDKRSLYDGLSRLGSELRSVLAELIEVEHTLHEIVEKNTILKTKNQRLREYPQELNQVAQAPAEDVRQEPSKSHTNPEKIYEEGFHICYDLYRLRRDNDEPCAFCLEMVHRENGR